MPNPIAICLEDLDAQDPTDQYMRCVAVAGRQPGLGLSGQGEILWEHAELGGCELWVSADDRLILLRPAEAKLVVVRRAGRSLEVPFDKPVVLLHQDELELAARRYRVHVHGPAPAVHPPTPFRPRALGAAATLAAAVAIGSPVAGCDKSDNIEVRDHPPAIAIPEEEDGGSTVKPDATATATATGTATAAATTKPTSPPIEVRDTPPAAPIREDPLPKPVPAKPPK